MGSLHGVKMDDLYSKSSDSWQVGLERESGVTSLDYTMKKAHTALVVILIIHIKVVFSSSSVYESSFSWLTLVIVTLVSEHTRSIHE